MPNSDTQKVAFTSIHKPETKRAILGRLMRDYPVLAQICPLKMGIEQDLLVRSSLSRRKIMMALRYHMRSKAYLLAIAQGGPRYDLDGRPAGEVTPEQQQQARETLEQREAEFQKRRMIQRGNTRLVPSPLRGAMQADR
ncbi:MAG: ProQ/FINO family protein [Gammaproteobacteria bacterium]